MNKDATISLSAFVGAEMMKAISFGISVWFAGRPNALQYHLP